MRYRIYGIEGIKAMLCDKIALLIIAAILFIPLQTLYSAFLNPSKDNMLGLMFTFVVMGPLLLIIALTSFISGWAISGDNLNLTISSVNTKLRIPALEVCILNDTKWAENATRAGTCIPGLLLSGLLYNIKKGLNITALQHLGYKRFVVIHTANQYYLIAHPGVEKLYDELLRLGATEKDFASIFY